MCRGRGGGIVLAPGENRTVKLVSFDRVTQLTGFACTCLQLQLFTTLARAKGRCLRLGLDVRESARCKQTRDRPNPFTLSFAQRCRGTANRTSKQRRKLLRRKKDLCFCFSPGLVHCCVLGRGHPNVRVNIFPPKQKPPPSSTLTITDTHTRPPKGGLNTAQGDLLLPVATMGTFTSTAGRAAGRAAFAFA